MLSLFVAYAAFCGQVDQPRRLIGVLLSCRAAVAQAGKRVQSVLLSIRRTVVNRAVQQLALTAQQQLTMVGISVVEQSGLYLRLFPSLLSDFRSHALAGWPAPTNSEKSTMTWNVIWQWLAPFTRAKHPSCDRGRTRAYLPQCSTNMVTARVSLL